MGIGLPETKAYEGMALRVSVYYTQNKVPRAVYHRLHALHQRAI